MRKSGKAHDLPRRTPGAESSRKVLSLLAYFEAARPSASMQTLARAIRAPKSTAYRYVSLLREFGFLMEVEGGQYALGPRALQLARAARAAISYAGVAHPVMERLSHDSGETAFLVRRVGDYAICIGRCDPVNPVRIFLEIGSAVPLHIGASPKLLLAHLASRERDSYLERVAAADGALKKGLGKLRAELERMRQDGSGITVDEITPGVWACAAPISEEGKVIAAVSVAGPAFRIGKPACSRFQAMVRAAAAEISLNLGK
ncbi:MAG TPA: IclR family transcriptional regulator [Burkholderiales bacterium]|nr:IclR family transcriptional regulator [Burkholderiales bacterium]